jgi:hypothetical protein
MRRKMYKCFFSFWVIYRKIECEQTRKKVLNQEAKCIHTYCTVSIHKFITKPCNEVWFGHGGVWFSSRIEGALSQFFRDVGIDVRSRMGEEEYVMMGWYDACN